MSRVDFEKKGHIAVITLNSPENLNALNSGFMGEIEEAVDKVEADLDIYAAIITGSDRAFIAGADIKEMLNMTSHEARLWVRQGSDLNHKIEQLRVPVIAAVNGFALGGGNELAMACDIRVASEKAKFGQPESKIGVTAGAGATRRLPRLVGLGKAKELLFTGKTIDAKEAFSIGLVDKVVPHDSLMDEAMVLAGAICANNGQIAVQEHKRLINVSLDIDIQTALILEQQAFAVTAATEDKQIGMSAFVNKQKEVHFVYR
jgi:enoyl-CoA hydratase